MQNLDEAIRERAYLLWVADGRGDGNADAYWLAAQRDLLTTSLGVMPAKPAKSQPAPKAKRKKRAA